MNWKGLQKNGPKSDPSQWGEKYFGKWTIYLAHFRLPEFPRISLFPVQQCSSFSFSFYGGERKREKCWSGVRAPGITALVQSARTTYRKAEFSPPPSQDVKRKGKQKNKTYCATPIKFQKNNKNLSFT
jgi:hypothetical protein